MRRPLILGTLLSVALATMALAQTAAPKDPSVFRIGAIMPMTGPGAFYGGLNSSAIQLAADEINAGGGINGIKIEIVVDDNKSGNAEASVTAMKRMISLSDVRAVLTSYSPSTLAIVPLAEQNDILLVNSGAASQQLAEASKLLLNDKSLATDLGRAVAQEAGLRGFRRMAIISTRTSAGDDIVNSVVGPWRQAGAEVVATETMAPGSTNIDTQIAKLKASNPDVLVALVFGEEPGVVMKRARQFGLRAPVIGLEYGPDAQKVGGDDMEGYLYINDYFVPSVESPWSLAFLRGFTERAKAPPNSYAANYYESTYLIAEAIRRARAAGGEYWGGQRLRDVISTNPRFPSVYGGDLSIQANGVALKRVGLFEVQQGQSKFLKAIDLSR
jgi:branched-chain amino acid transport system substrate-binding protein